MFHLSALATRVVAYQSQVVGLSAGICCFFQQVCMLVHCIFHLYLTLRNSCRKINNFSPIFFFFFASTTIFFCCLSSLLLISPPCCFSAFLATNHRRVTNSTLAGIQQDFLPVLSHLKSNGSP